MAGINSMGMMSFITGAARGYQDQEDRQRRREQEDKDRAYQDEARNRQRNDWQRQDAQDAALRDAAQPVAVQEAQGTPSDAGPTQAFKVGDQQAPTPQAAQALQAEQNSPVKATLRQAAAVQGMNPSMAATLRAQARQQELADLQLSEIQAKRVRDDFDRQLSVVPSFDAVADHISDSKIRGDLKIKFVPTADGKGVQAAAIMPDGTLKTAPNAPVYSNDAAGLLRAKSDLAANTTIADQINWLHHDQAAKAAAAKAEMEDRKQGHKEKVDDARLENDRRRLENDGRRIDAMVSMMGARTDAILAKIGGGGDGDGGTSIPGVNNKQFRADMAEGRKYVIDAFSARDADGNKVTDHRLVELGAQAVMMAYAENGGDIGAAQAKGARLVEKQYKAFKSSYPNATPQQEEAFIQSLSARISGAPSPSPAPAAGATSQPQPAPQVPAASMAQVTQAPRRADPGVSAMFDRDAKTMSPQQLMQKYGGATESLSPQQRAQMQYIPRR